MILTLTANPSSDRTVTLAGPLKRGAVLRAASTTAQAGGKGVNISRAAVAAGLPTVAVLPAAPHDPFVAELRAAGIDCRPLEPAGPVRVNLTISEPDGTTTKVNDPGAAVERRHLDLLADAVVALAAEATWVVLAGSLPPGAPAGWYAELVRRLRTTRARVAVDTSEAPLAALAAALPAAAPDLMKPNGEELATLTGGDPVVLESDPAAAATAARALVDRGVGAVLVTLGSAGGVLVTADGAWHAPAPPTAVVSTVGAGDSSLFGYLLATERGLPPAERLALAVAYGSAAAGLPGTTIPRPTDVDPRPVHATPLTPSPTP
ncbi:1-phosphofructokinase family hexose kinase [Georgenia sp. 311]|uniref:1-phosphofructokinase family hexose kinase n=1 Tax=Georgenia sp. 311 TaxID=2585134 RepID=UPI00111266CC|nr:1-phosphofructokinase family hexose kinase [Georgenia sp. 311]TNC19791.1 1-phosphofructokinase family hexose kinase [Georgenia sp. 311]